MKIILCSMAFILLQAAGLLGERKPAIDFRDHAGGNLSSEPATRLRVEREGNAGHARERVGVLPVGHSQSGPVAERDPVIAVFPPTGYDQATVYLNLALFWAGIIGLVILLRLKLRELERVQNMERKEAEKAAPLLE